MNIKWQVVKAKDKKVSYYDIVTISLVVLTASSLIFFNIFIISIISMSVAAPVALFPDLTQCQGQPFKGNPDVIEYKCPPINNTRNAR